MCLDPHNLNKPFSANKYKLVFLATLHSPQNVVLELWIHAHKFHRLKLKLEKYRKTKPHFIFHVSFSAFPAKIVFFLPWRFAHEKFVHFFAILMV